MQDCEGQEVIGGEELISTKGDENNAGGSEVMLRSTAASLEVASRYTAISPFRLPRHSVADDLHGDFAVPSLPVHVVASHPRRFRR